jgi:hypothetical protein
MGLQTSDRIEGVYCVAARGETTDKHLWVMSESTIVEDVTVGSQEEGRGERRQTADG